MRNSNQILHGDQTILEENFYMVEHCTCPGQNFVTGTLTRDLFAIANFLVVVVVIIMLTSAKKVMFSSA